ncbi:hypothetical protein D3C80_1876000 [compost metagenome]
MKLQDIDDLFDSDLFVNVAWDELECEVEGTVRHTREEYFDIRVLNHLIGPGVSVFDLAWQHGVSNLSSRHLEDLRHRLFRRVPRIDP